jgi:hypothetical protein
MRLKPKIHALAGGLAIVTIATFWVSSFVSEVFLTEASVIEVKRSIVYYGLAPLVLFMAITGGSGNLLTGNRQNKIVQSKLKRMKVLALNGFLVMIPSALFLHHKASLDEFDRMFYSVQALELAVGLLQLFLLGQNFRQGLLLSGKLKAKS